MIELNNIYLSIKNRNIFEGLSLRLLPGEILGVIGSPGSGKSCLIDICSGAVPYEGNLLINRQEHKSYSKRELSRLVTSSRNHVLQKHHWKTAEQYILEGRNPWRSGINPYSPEDRNICGKAEALFELSEYLNIPAKECNSSVMARIILARCFAAGTPYLFLDEPTRDLDPKSSELLGKAIKKYVRNGKNALMITGHDLNFIIQKSDRIMALKNGKIISEGDWKTINEKLLKELYKTNFLMSYDPVSGKPLIHSQILD